jgi:carbonic anhydrase
MDQIRESTNEVPLCRSNTVIMDNFDYIMDNNKIWAANNVQRDSKYFKDLVEIQKPEYLWIGCSDSRVPSN